MGTECDALVEPTALLFLLAALNWRLKILIEYFVLTGVSALEKANLMLKCLQFIHETMVKIVSLTSDGTSINFVMCKKFGAFLDYSNFKPKNSKRQLIFHK